MSTVYVALGSNLGDRLQHLQHAIRRLKEDPQVQLRAMSTILETEPLGDVPQGRYLNCVIALETPLTPQALLRLLQSTETVMGRPAQGARWGPRIIDLDILLYDGAVINTPELVIPHPEMHRRRFVLEPLAQIAPAAVHPVLRKTTTELLAALPS